MLHLFRGERYCHVAALRPIARTADGVNVFIFNFSNGTKFSLFCSVFTNNGFGLQSMYASENNLLGERTIFFCSSTYIWRSRRTLLMRKFTKPLQFVIWKLNSSLSQLRLRADHWIMNLALCVACVFSKIINSFQNVYPFEDVENVSVTLVVSMTTHGAQITFWAVFKLRPSPCGICFWASHSEC